MKRVFAAALLAVSCAGTEPGEPAPSFGGSEWNAGVPSPGAGEARIVYDRFRIPHVFVQGDLELFFALGYLQARDFPVATLANLWSASGRFAEVAGKSVLARDRRVRQFGIDERARAQASDPALLDPEVKRFLEAYVDGVDAGRRWWLADRARFEALLGEGSEGSALWFDPVPPFLDPFVVKEDPRPRLERLFTAEVTLEHVLALGVALNGGPEFMGAGYSLFTNVWTARNGADSAESFMLVDSHQPIQRAGARGTFVQLAGKAYDVAGYTMPGYPCVVLGFNAELAFSITTLPQPPIRLQERIREEGLPFRYRGSAPVTSETWEAELEPGSLPRIRRGDETIELKERVATLRYWDVDRGALIEDPEGPLTFYSVPARELGSSAPPYPVTGPPPEKPIDPAQAQRIRYEGRSFLSARSPWEFWIRVGRARRVGTGKGGVDEVLDDAAIAFGRGQLFDAVDAAGGLEHAWTSRVPILGEGGTWRGFHGLAEVPRFFDGGGFGERPEIWIDCNASPHFVRASGGFDGAHLPVEVLEQEPWKSRRQDRARELLERAAADGRLSLGELEQAALDVQDPWARAMWPLARALAGEAGAEAIADARAFAAWVDEHRFDGPRGEQGSEEFLATPDSEVTVFTTLLRGFFEEGLLSLADPSADELGLAFDPCASVPSPEAFLDEERWARARAALRDALERAAQRFERGFENALLFPGEPGARTTWGDVHFLSLTPHQRRLRSGKDFGDALNSILRPADVSAATPFHRAQAPRVFPIGGTEDTLFQLDAGAVEGIEDALHPTRDGVLYLQPVDFGSQIAWVVRLKQGERPRARFLALLGTTEVTCAIPGSAIAEGDHFATTDDFARGVWKDFLLERSELEQGARAVLELGIERDEASGRFGLARSD